MILRIYIDSVSPGNLIDEVEQNIQGALAANVGSVGETVSFYTRAIRSKTAAFPTPAAGTHTFIFTIQPDDADTTNGPVTIAQDTGIIQAQLVTAAP